jgi:hypothetical protein
VSHLLRLACLLLAVSFASGAALAQQQCASNDPRFTAATPDSDFVDAGNGAVRHVPTGLIWQRCAEGQAWNGTTCTGTALAYTWQQAFQRADAVNAASAETDWRLPNRNELRSIVEGSCVNPSINSAQFPSTPVGPFWSSSPFSDTSLSSPAWEVDFSNGSDGDRGVPALLRLVRGGQYPHAYDVLTAPAAAVLPDDGLWVIDAENNGQSGRGFQVETRNGTLVFTYYGYRSGGHDHWYLSAGTIGLAGFAGTMTQYGGGAALGASYTPATANGSAGTLVLSSGTTTTGTLILPGEGAKSVSKFAFSGSTSPSVVPSNGLWVINAENNGQAGRGFQIEQHGGTLVFTYYGYDSAGLETWYLAAGAMSGNSFTGNLTEYGGGTVLGSSYAAATTSGSAGQVTISFASPTTGTITLPGESVKAISKFVW